jgi:hypothetical protein
LQQNTAAVFPAGKEPFDRGWLSLPALTQRLRR